MQFRCFDFSESRMAQIVEQMIASKKKEGEGLS